MKQLEKKRVLKITLSNLNRDQIKAIKGGSDFWGRG